MPTTSQVPSVIGYLIDIFTAAATLGAASPPVAVFLGPQLTESFAPLALFVGLEDSSGSRGGDLAGATSRQEWASMPAGPRDEQLTVHNYAEAWSGDTDTRSALLAAYGIIAAVENVLRADVSLGGGFRFQLPGLTNSVARWHQGDGGAACRISFDIDVKARIGV